MKLTPQENELATHIGFDEKVLVLVKQITKVPIEQMYGYDDEGKTQPVNAFVVSAEHKHSERILLALREKLRSLGCLAFCIDHTSNFENRPDKIAVLNTTDEMQVLRLLNTNACNYEMENEDIIARMQEWAGRFSYEILGAEYDSIEMLFHTLPDDMNAFARELYDFCPDLLDQGYAVMLEEALDGLPPEQQERIQRSLDEEPEREDKIERAALRLLADDIEQTRRLTLWWD